MMCYSCSLHEGTREHWSGASGSLLGTGNGQEKFPGDLEKWDSLCYRGCQKAVNEITVFLARGVTAGYTANGSSQLVCDHWIST